MIPEPVTLAGQWVELAPLQLQHAADLYTAGNDPEVWEYMTVHTPDTLEKMTAWVQNALETQARGEMLPFAIIERATSKAIGSTRYMDYSAQHRHVEIGWTWLGRSYWRTAINTECKYLLLKHAFEDLGCIRVQLKTDWRNERSQRAIERLGAVREGILRKAVIIKDGYQRSTVYYSILDTEWSMVKMNLEQRLYRSSDEGAIRV